MNLYLCEYTFILQLNVYDLCKFYIILHTLNVCLCCKISDFHWFMRLVFKIDQSDFTTDIDPGTRSEFFFNFKDWFLDFVTL